MPVADPPARDRGDDRLERCGPARSARRPSARRRRAPRRSPPRRARAAALESTRGAMPVRLRSSWKPRSPPQQVAHQHQRPAVADHVEARAPPDRRSPPAAGSRGGCGSASGVGIPWTSTNEYLSDIIRSIQGILKCSIRPVPARRPPRPRQASRYASGVAGGGQRIAGGRLTARGRKVRAPQGREVANGDPGRPEGKRNRNHTADGRRSRAAARGGRAGRHRQG